MKFADAEAALIMLLMMLPIVSLTLHTGGTLHSLFFVGLGANSLALPLFFFFIGKLQDGPGTRNTIILSLLLSVITLLHFITAAITIVVTLILTLINFKKEAATHFLAITLLAFLLCSFWIVPFLAYIKYYGGSFIGGNLGSFLSIPVFLMILLGAIIAVVEKDPRLNGIFLTLLLLSLLLFFIDFAEYKLPFHSYRFLIYPLLLIMVLPAKLIFNQQNSRAKFFFAALFIFLLGIYLYRIFPFEDRQIFGANRLYWHNPDNLNYDSLNPGKLDGRIIIFNGDLVPHIHDLRHLAIMASGCQELKGLFIESSINGRFVGSLHANAVRGGFLWGIEAIPMEREQYLTFKPDVLQKNLDLFNVNHILVNHPIKQLKPERRIKIEKDQKEYFLYRIGSSKLVELLAYRPTAVPYLWEDAVKKWFRSKDTKILAKTPRLPAQIASPQDSVTVAKMSKNQDYLKLRVEAKEDVPILIKMSYFPRWHAYVNGKEVPLYVTSPYLMLVYGSGTIELKYKSSFYDYLGWTLSLTGLLAAVGLIQSGIITRCYRG